MKRRVLAVLLSTAMVLSLAACGSGGSGSEDQGNSGGDDKTLTVFDSVCMGPGVQHSGSGSSGS